MVTSGIYKRKGILTSGRSVRRAQLEDKLMYTRRALQILFTFLLVPLLCTVLGCGQTVAVLPAATATATLLPAATATATNVDGCPSPWENFPAFSASVVAGMVPLPPKTRVIMVNSAPGAADATLCTQGATAASINTFMMHGLTAKGWREDRNTGHWDKGAVLEVDWKVTTASRWSLECVCGGI